ncbi:hypothetical protein Tco_0366869 [Tanacetum coccineum]
MVSLSFSIWKCCGHIEMWVKEASKSKGQAVGHVTCTELVADWAFDLIKAEKLAFLLSKSKSWSNWSSPFLTETQRFASGSSKESSDFLLLSLLGGKKKPFYQLGSLDIMRDAAVAFVVVLQDSNVLRPRSERACWRTTAIPFLRAKRSAFATEKVNGQREGSRLSRTLAKLDSHSKAL